MKKIGCLNVLRQVRLLLKRAYYHIDIMNNIDTIDYIIDNKLSIARFGDGELGMITGEASISFQGYSAQLSAKLLEVMQNPGEKCLICVPKCMLSSAELEPKTARWWENWALNGNNLKSVISTIRNNAPKRYLFGDAMLTRAYMANKSQKLGKRNFDKLKCIWKDRDILIVEGELTRMGVANDLFNNAQSIRRIIAPAENAFDRYSELLDIVRGYAVCNEVVLIALGPTATVLACELSKAGIQALDVGHIDIEYEWFLNGAMERTIVRGKYVNEVVGGRDISDVCTDEYYEKQIVARCL